MSMIQGLHHITGAATSGQRDHDFYTQTLGLRRVKKTINHETANQWHLFYGDYEGNAGTIMTNFIFEDAPLRPWKPGKGMINDVAFSVPKGSLDFWQQRLEAAGLSTERRGQRFGEEVLGYQDPSGIRSELIEHDDERDPPALGDLDDSNKVRGFHSTAAISRIPELTHRFFVDLLHAQVVGEENGRTRLSFADQGKSGYLDLLDGEGLDWGHFGIGCIHHVAFTVGSKAEMEILWRILSGTGAIVTDLRDRKWFHSMYMTEPGGINIEFSNMDPGWTVDEPLEELGTVISLPKQWEAEREQIEAKLPALDFGEPR